MDGLPLRWVDEFRGQVLDARWVGGHTNDSREASVEISNGFRVTLAQGTQYASAGIALRTPVVGDFDVRVAFHVSAPAKGTTFEVAAVTVDPPRESALDNTNEALTAYGRSRIYDVHGAPPYVSSEFDENDGWRIGWNRAAGQTRPGPTGVLIADNHFNRYGHTSGPKPTGETSGWLRLVRTGDDWTSYRSGEGAAWVPTGMVRWMNMPLAVFIRLAAKHWPKVEGRAPANAVTFTRVELRSAVPPDVAYAPASHELSRAPVSLLATQPSAMVDRVRAVRACQRCGPFWKDTVYGPIIQVQPAKPGKATIKAFAQPEPATLYGCRKAPVMLVGINPNLPSHFPGRSGFVTPFFDSDAAYAEHYRKAPGPRLAIEPEAMASLLENDGRIVATKDGRLVVDRESASASARIPGQRKARLVVDYDGEDPPVQHDITWQRGQSFAMFRPSFKAGEAVAGILTERVVGYDVPVVTDSRRGAYYEHAEQLVKLFAARRGGPGLELGEDMSLHDAVACASPNWNNNEFSTSAVEQACVREQRWMHRDLAECAPAVVVLAGRVALGLFAQPSEGRLSHPLDTLPQRAGGVDGLFDVVARKGLWWNYRVGGDERTVRLVVGPHFSYPDNMRPQCYFPEEDWRQFEAQHPALVADLTRRRMKDGPVVRKAHGTSDTQVFIDKEDPLWAETERIDRDAVATMRSWWIHPLDRIAEAVVAGLDERGVARIGSGHLGREKGSCDYCDNAAWKIGQGCAYVRNAP
ncbi:MAG: hypothetical protein ING90_15335 [Rhodocyclaceae bacterium]|nr:hypothetical protein [Rhodocyclaceae bacterium]